MKNQQNIVQAMKCCLSNGKFALLFISIFFLFTSCKQSGSQNSESISDQVSNLISSSPCDKFIGKYSRQQTASSITTTSNIEFKKDQNFYKLFITANSTTNNPSLQMAVNITNERFKATFPSDGIVCTCNDKGNIEINIDGKKVESMIDNSGNLIYGGLTFYKTNNESNSVATEEATEITTDKNINEPIEIFTEKDVEAMESTNQKLVTEQFVGEWKQYMQPNIEQKEFSLSIKELSESKIELNIKEIYASIDNFELDIVPGKYIGYLDAKNRFVVKTNKKDITYYLEKSKEHSSGIDFLVEKRISANNTSGSLNLFFKK